MKGIVFTEFIEMVENKFGFETADRIITASSLKSEGAYTAVGTYDFDEMVQLLTHLSKSVSLPIPDLLKAFGGYLFERFYKLYPHFFTGHENAFTFLCDIEGYIHVEVLKLYPDAELPRIETRMKDDNSMEMIYRSTRALSDLALGLIGGCVAHFREELAIEKKMLEEDGTVVMFTLRKTT